MNLARITREDFSATLRTPFVNFPVSPAIKTDASTAGRMGLIPSWGPKIPHVMRCSQIKKNISCHHSNDFPSLSKEGEH